MSDDSTRQSALAELAAALVRQRIRADNPPTTSIATRANVGRGTVSRIFDGRQLPDWKQLVAIVQACEGQPADFRELWEVACAEVQHMDNARLAARASDAFGANQERALVTYYDTTAEFYTAAADRVAEATSEIRLTYIRQYPPARFANSAAARYFDTVLAWAKRTGNPVSRVIGVPVNDGVPNADLVAWVKTHQAEVHEIPSYEFRVIEWCVGTDALNMALIDRSTIFLTFSGINSQHLSGTRIDSERYIERFIGYFDQTWHHSMSAFDYLRKIY